MKKWITMAAAALMVASTAARADDNWMTQRMCWGPCDDGKLFHANEFSMDLFGEYKARERSFEHLATSDFKHGKWGGGIGGNYFFDRYLGIGVDTAALSQSVKFIDHVGGNLLLRFPIDVAHLAPYLFGGGGYSFGSAGDPKVMLNSSDSWYADVGAGLEFRFNCKVGLFGDAQYIWRQTDRNVFGVPLSNQAAVRVGMKFVM